MSYKAIVARIHTRELPGADNLVVGNCLGYQVLVQKNTPQDALGVFFEGGGQLSEEFCQVHDLVERHDAHGNRAGGFFQANRKVRSIKLRGVKSEGFWCPIEHLAYTGYDLSKLTEGTQFEELNGHPICNKYITKATRERSHKVTSSNRAETRMFRKHVDTEALRRSVHLIPTGAICYLTRKLHGTSFRYGHVLDEVPAKLGRWESFWRRLRKLGPKFVPEWTYLHGSRNVILQRRKEDEQGFYGKEDFRQQAVHSIMLRKGEVLYGELVGYTETGASIMAAQSTAVLKDKSIEKRFGREIVYKYGCLSGECAAYIYRITQMNEDGYPVELSWPQVVARCAELGLKPVPPAADPFIYDGHTEALLEKVSRLVDGETGSEALPSVLDPSHPEEGVVLRYESEHGTGWLKHKSFVFGCLEGYLKESDTYVDTEEAA